MSMHNVKPALPTDRAGLIRQTQSNLPFDLVIIGGGATGLGTALEAATRGYRVALFEKYDFAKGTSSRSTKLVHGGVRYLAQGNVSLVKEALHERSTVLQSAPHLAQPLGFLMPCYKAWQIPFYWTGLRIYDTLAGRHSLGRTEVLNARKTLETMPNVLGSGLIGSVKYWDGQFDDARLALAIARTAQQQGAALLNYCEVESIEHLHDRVSGVSVRDTETGQTWRVKTSCVVNATGVWVDTLRQMDDQAAGRNPQKMVAPSQGVHVVVDRSFMESDHALIVPKTSDGRVLFAVPWLGKVILGTTDTPRQETLTEPCALRAELDFILKESAAHLQKAPSLQDIRSIWVGLRPLVKPQSGDSGNTKSISREHTIVSSKSGLVTVTGGKWTTYRVMSKDTVNHCIKHGVLNDKGTVSRTDTLRLIGAQSGRAVARPLSETADLSVYGDERDQVTALDGADDFIAPGLSQAMVRFAARHEYARTVEDVLARRNRLLFLDAAKAQECAPIVAQILQSENVPDPKLGDFLELCKQYKAIPEY